MAPTSAWAETTKRSLEDVGFLELQDSMVGERINGMESRNFPYGTVYALEFLEHVIFDPRIRDILKESFEECSLGHSLRYTSNPNRYFRFWPGGSRSPLILVVHQWARGSHVDYWTGSHKVALPILEAGVNDNRQGPSEPLPENSREALVNAGCTPQPFNFKDGGLIIADARTSFERKSGYEFANVFFPNHLLPRLKMPLPCSSEVVEKFHNMREKSREIGLNFEIQDQADVGKDSSKSYK